MERWNVQRIAEGFILTKIINVANVFLLGSKFSKVRILSVLLITYHETRTFWYSCRVFKLICHHDNLCLSAKRNRFRGRGQHRLLFFSKALHCLKLLSWKRDYAHNTFMLVLGLFGQLQNKPFICKIDLVFYFWLFLSTLMTVYYFNYDYSVAKATTKTLEKIFFILVTNSLEIFNVICDK